MIKINTMNELLNYIDIQKEGMGSIYIYIKLPNCKEPELIVNTFTDIDSKRAYYEKIYNDDLTNKYNKEIQIVGVSNSLNNNFIIVENETIKHYRKIANEIIKELNYKGYVI